MWTWRYEDAAGQPRREPKPESFPTQSDAESWLGERWRDLLSVGVEQVSLLNGDTPEYTMSLRNPD